MPVPHLLRPVPSVARCSTSPHTHTPSRPHAHAPPQTLSRARRDIVPRAFVCDYTLVADLLKQWLPSFREHPPLQEAAQHKSLYNFLGKVAVLKWVQKRVFCGY